MEGRNFSGAFGFARAFFAARLARRGVSERNLVGDFAARGFGGGVFGDRFVKLGAGGIDKK